LNDNLFIGCSFRTDVLVSAGDVVNIVGDFDSNGICRVSNAGNFVVVEPDFLLSGTSIVNSVHCMRKYVDNVLSILTTDSLSVDVSSRSALGLL